MSHWLLFLRIPAVEVESGVMAASGQPSARETNPEAALGRCRPQESCGSVRAGGDFRAQRLITLTSS